MKGFSSVFDELAAHEASVRSRVYTFTAVFSLNTLPGRRSARTLFDRLAPLF